MVAGPFPYVPKSFFFPGAMNFDALPTMEVYDSNNSLSYRVRDNIKGQKVPHGFVITDPAEREILRLADKPGKSFCWHSYTFYDSIGTAYTLKPKESKTDVWLLTINKDAKEITYLYRRAHENITGTLYDGTTVIATVEWTTAADQVPKYQWLVPLFKDSNLLQVTFLQPDLKPHLLLALLVLAHKYQVRCGW